MVRFQIGINLSKVTKRFPAYLKDTLHIYRVNTALARFESNLIELYPVVPLDSYGRDSDITKEVVLGDYVHNRPQLILLHQTKWSIGISYPFVKHKPYYKTERFCYKYTACPILSALAITYLKVVVLTVLKHLPELFGVCLTIGVCLKDIVRAMLQSVTI